MTQETKQKQKEFSNSIDKTLSVIDCIFQKEGTFIEIQNRLNLPKATLHRILQSLEKYELIEKVTPADTYRLGLKFIYYSEAVKARISLSSLAEKYLKELAASTGESSSLTVLYQNRCMSLSGFPGEQSALTSNLLPFPSLNCSASGKLFLSTWNDAKLKDFFSNPDIKKLTHNTITTFDAFKQEQKKILEKGMAYDDEENEYGLYCMCAPLQNHTGRINATIGITAPKSRLFMKDVASIETQVRTAASKISDVLIKTKCECPY